MREITDGDDFLFAADVLNQHRNFPRGTVVVGTSGLEVTSDGTDLTLDVASGQASIDNTSQSLSASTVTLDTASSFDRYDLVVVEDDGSGTYVTTSVTGTQERVTPTLQPTQVLLAIVLVPANTTSIPSGNVLDARLLSTSTENDGTFNTLQVQTAPSADQDVVRKLELDTKSGKGHAHNGETITPATVENGDYTWTSTELMMGLNISDNGGSNKVGFGAGATVGGNSAVAIGHNSTADGGYATSVGHDTEASSSSATAYGDGARATNTNATAIGPYSTVSGLSSIGLGHGVSVTDDDSIAIGGATVETDTGTDLNIAIGEGAEVTQGNNTLGIGPRVSVTDEEAVALGADASVSGTWAVTIGRNSTAAASSAVALGRDATVTANSGVALGPYANVATDGVGHIAVDQLAFGAINGTIPDGDLNNQEMTIEADEANSQFQIRYKDSNGTIQTGTITFD